MIKSSLTLIALIISCSAFCLTPGPKNTVVVRKAEARKFLKKDYTIDLRKTFVMGDIFYFEYTSTIIGIPYKEMAKVDCCLVKSDHAL